MARIVLWLALTLMLLTTTLNQASAQNSRLTVAKTDIDQAISSIQMAAIQGASNSDLLPLVEQLNIALELETNASLIEQTNPNMADTLANSSITISTQVSASAVRLGNEAKAASLYRKTASYSVALVLAVIASIAVFDLDRLRRRLQQRRANGLENDGGRPSFEK
ncbi:hypothetical protein J2P12_07850 [Candidatus Bathyarchaeota archaeon]|nr:hypothetical protein [Candidatus Bathyarchaeota archaeon]